MEQISPPLSGEEIRRANIPVASQQCSTSHSTNSYKYSYSLDLGDPVQVKNYCLGIIDAVRAINAASHTPSAFCCILDAMCFFATISTTKRNSVSRGGSSGKTKTSYKQEFVDFVTQFMDPQYASIAADLYSVVRCGLCHSMSVSINSSQQPFVLTHNTTVNSHLSKIHSLQNGPIVLVAECLCDDVEAAVKAMFASVSSTIMSNIQSNPPIAAYSTT